MWTVPERVYITRYQKNCSVMLRQNEENRKLEFYMQNTGEKDWHFCFDLSWEEVTEVTGETAAEWYKMSGGDQLVRTFHDRLKPYEETSTGNPYAREVQTKDFLPDETLMYGVGQGELVMVNARIESIRLLETEEEHQKAYVLLEDRTGTVAAFVDEEVYPSFAECFEEGSLTRAIGRAYLPTDPEDGTFAYFDVYEFQFR